MKKSNTQCNIGQIVLDGVPGVNGDALGPLIHQHLNRMAGPSGFTATGQVDLGDLALELERDADENQVSRAIAEAIYGKLHNF